MRVLCLLLLPGCLFIDTDTYSELWDRDGDGWGLEEDCDDDNAAIHPYALDVRGDGCDADCSRAVGTADADGDDWPDEVDCAPDDATTHPCAGSTELDCGMLAVECNQVHPDDTAGTATPISAAECGFPAVPATGTPD